MSEGWRAWTPGTRVVVRRRLPAGERGGHLFTDVLGHVVAVSDDGVTVRTDPTPRAVRDGARREDVHVPAGDVVLGKVVPERPVRG